MIRAGLLGILSTLGVLSAGGQEAVPAALCDTACVFQAIWSQAERLDEDKQARMARVLVETVALTDDPALMGYWSQRTGYSSEVAEDYEDYALSKVSQFLAEEGWEEFFNRARSGQRPFNSGRPEMMAAAAQHLADEDTAEKILSLMEQLAKADVSQVAFERAAFGHALAEAAMRRCDLQSFDRALQLTDAPDNLRYAFWRTRMEGMPGDLQARISEESDGENTTPLRQALDGFAAVLKYGACEAAPISGDTNLER